MCCARPNNWFKPQENAISTAADSRADGYESFYREFDLPLMRQLRREAYGEDYRAALMGERG